MSLEDLSEVERELLETTQDAPLVFSPQMIQTMVATLGTTTEGLVAARTALRAAGYIDQEVNDSGFMVLTITPAGEALFD